MPHNRHMHTWQKFFIGFTATALLMAGTAALASYVTRSELASDIEESQEQEKKPAATTHRTQPRQQLASAQTAQAQPACDDGNVLGYLAGGAVGGILGNQVGKGSGNTAATIGGAVGGAYVGGKYLPTRGATCR